MIKSFVKAAKVVELSRTKEKFGLFNNPHQMGF